jgi:hypothetical protein
MSNILNRQQTFSTNGTVTAAALHNLIDSALVNSAIIKNQQEVTSIGTADLLLIAPDSVDASLAPRKVSVQNLIDDSLSAGVFTSASFTGTVTAGSVVAPVNGNVTGNLTGNVTGNISSTLSTFGTTNSTAATITNGTIQTLTASTATITGGTYSGAINSTLGTIATLNSTTGTIGNFSTTLTGDLTISTGSATVGTRVAVVNTAQQYSRAHNFAATALTITSGTVPWDLSQNQVSTLSVNTTTTMNAPTNPQAGATYVLIVTQSGGNNTLSFSTAYKFPGGTVPVLSTGASQVDVLSFVSNGTVLYGVSSQNFS